MTILIDTNYIVALANNRDKNHQRAVEILDNLLVGEWGPRISLDYVLDETITTVWSRTENHESVKMAYGYFLGNHTIVQIDYVTEDIISKAWQIFQKYTENRRPLSFTDCVLLSYAKNRNIDYILSFDSEFDGIIRRIY